ncbi:MAG: ABC transporter substrate-binding protein [Synergistaceae bacterium]|nr:ABC transporter substrate-binding protein [Synergistota bacterium]NLM71017.1 ABC transporter substrate-binding protein [Synergistaceae bacterium]
MRIRAIATIAAAVGILFAAIFIAGFFFSDDRLEVPVTLFYDDKDISGAVVSKQALQSVVLAMEFFNARSKTHRFIPTRESDMNVYNAIERAAARKSAAVIGGINAPFASLLADASRRQGISFISLASGHSLARPDDLVFRPRPENGGRELGEEARDRGIKAYAVIVSGFAASHVQDFIRDFQSAIGTPPLKIVSFSSDLKTRIEDLQDYAQDMDAVLLVLPDWLCSVALRELRHRFPGIPVFLSNWAVSHRIPLLAGPLGDGAFTASYTDIAWDSPGNEFVRFVRNTYTSSIPRMILAIGYDTVAMLDAAVKMSGSSDKQAVATALSELESVETIGGVFPVDKNGDLRHRGQIFTLRSGHWARGGAASDTSSSARPGGVVP